MPPIGIGIGVMPPPWAAPAMAAVALGMAPIPDIAELTMRAGIEPCQVGGTDIAPTNRALPRSAPMPPPRPPAPPNGLRSAGTALPTNLVASAPNPAALALAKAAAEPAPLLPAIWNTLINGEIAMLAGYIAICATDVNGDNPDAADSTDDKDTPDNAEVTSVPNAVNDPPAPDTADVTDVSTDENQPARPAKLIVGTSNCANVDATAADVV